MARMIFCHGIDPESVYKIGAEDGSLADLETGNTILLRSETGEAERTIIALRVEGRTSNYFSRPTGSAGRLCFRGNERRLLIPSAWS